jgi:hypothetical protein
MEAETLKVIDEVITPGNLAEETMHPGGTLGSWLEKVVGHQLTARTSL